jgi:integrase
VLLAGEAGLRVGEVMGLRWADVDVVAGTITVAQKIRRGQVGVPKGRRRRTIPMTAALASAISRMSAARTGYVGADTRGEVLTECEARELLRRVLRHAALPKRTKLWHLIRHNTEFRIIRRVAHRRCP